MYDRDWVERNLRYVWDLEHNPLNPLAPDSEMRGFRASQVVSHQDPPGLSRAEIRRAWQEQFDLSRDERAALVLCFGMGFEQWEAAEVEGVTHQAISNRCYRGVGKLVEFLTGEPVNNEDTTEQDRSNSDEY